MDGPRKWLADAPQQGGQVVLAHAQLIVVLRRSRRLARAFTDLAHFLEDRLMVRPVRAAPQARVSRDRPCCSAARRWTANAVGIGRAALARRAAWIWDSSRAISSLSARARSEIGSGFFLNHAMTAAGSVTQQEHQQRGQREPAPPRPAARSAPGPAGKARRSCCVAKRDGRRRGGSRRARAAVRGRAGQHREFQPRGIPLHPRVLQRR